MNENNEDTAQFRIVEMGIGDTSYYNNGYIILRNVLKNPSNERFHFKPDDIALVADLQLIAKDSSSYQAFPAIIVDSMGILQMDDTLYQQNLFLKFAGVVEKEQKIKIGIKESDKIIDFITVKTYEFPFIIFVWMGLTVLALGIAISTMHRANIKGWRTYLVYALLALGMIYMFFIAGA
jgi:cytochrome c-type biogenesis protein CcmF